MTTTATAKRRRTSKSIPKKTAYPITRKATFVGDLDLAATSTLNTLSGSVNPVSRTELNRRSLVRGGPTVYFKPHDGGMAPSQYAVASVRLARFLGMEKVISHNAFATIRNQKGVVSGTVPGAPLRTLEHNNEIPAPAEAKTRPEIDLWLQGMGSRVVEKDGKFFELTGSVYNWVDLKDPDIQKGMSDLQLFDAISGQRDRHAGNIFIDPDTGKVTGIDDDLSFGKGTSPDDLAKSNDKYPGLPSLVDKATAERILRLRPENLKAFLAHRENDLRDLTPEEIRDAQTRLSNVQTYLRKLQASGALVETWDDNTYQEAMQDPDKSYLGRAAVDLQTALQGGTIDGYPVRVAPPTQQPPTLWAPSGLPTSPRTRAMGLAQARFGDQQVDDEQSDDQSGDLQSDDQSGDQFVGQLPPSPATPSPTPGDLPRRINRQIPPPVLTPGVRGPVSGPPITTSTTTRTITTDTEDLTNSADIEDGSDLSEVSETADTLDVTDTVDPTEVTVRSRLDRPPPPSTPPPSTPSPHRPPLPTQPLQPQGRPRWVGGASRLQGAKTRGSPAGAARARIAAVQPSPRNPTITTTITRSAFVPPRSRRSPAQAPESRLGTARVRPDAPAEEKGE
jgi:hypothetical protein